MILLLVFTKKNKQKKNKQNRERELNILENKNVEEK